LNEYSIVLAPSFIIEKEGLPWNGIITSGIMANVVLVIVKRLK
jgi:hypothetical protein